MAKKKKPSKLELIDNTTMASLEMAVNSGIATKEEMKRWEGYKGLCESLAMSPSQQAAKLVRMARAYTEQALATIVNVMEDADAQPKDRLNAAGMILDRGYGKAAQLVQIEDVRQISDEELLRAVAELNAKICKTTGPVIEAKFEDCKDDSQEASAAGGEARVRLEDSDGGDDAGG